MASRGTGSVWGLCAAKGVITQSGGELRKWEHRSSSPPQPPPWNHGHLPPLHRLHPPAKSWRKRRGPGWGRTWERLGGHCRRKGPRERPPNPQQLCVWQKGRINIWDSERCVTGTGTKLALSQNSQAHTRPLSSVSGRGAPSYPRLTNHTPPGVQRAQGPEASGLAGLEDNPIVVKKGPHSLGRPPRLRLRSRSAKNRTWPWEPAPLPPPPPAPLPSLPPPPPRPPPPPPPPPESRTGGATVRKPTHTCDMAQLRGRSKFIGLEGHRCESCRAAPSPHRLTD